VYFVTYITIRNIKLKKNGIESKFGIRRSSYIESKKKMYINNSELLAKYRFDKYVSGQIFSLL